MKGFKVVEKLNQKEVYRFKTFANEKDFIEWQLYSHRVIHEVKSHRVTSTHQFRDTNRPETEHGIGITVVYTEEVSFNVKGKVVIAV